MLAIHAAPAWPISRQRGTAWLAAVAPFGLLAFVGLELALLTAFLGDTVNSFLHGPTADFHNLYEVAHNRELPGLYSPFLVVLLYPIALLPEMAAYRVFFALNVGCVIGIALMMPTAVRSFEARTALALAPLALPQLHWALRLGHLTPAICFIALLALVTLHRRPVRGVIMLALLSIKPQYLIAPMAYLVWKRYFRLAAIVVGASALLAAAGFALIGPSSIGQFVSYYLDWGPNSADNLLPVQQSWMVSWPGFQISLGNEAHPLITIDLILLSLAVALFAWTRADAASSAAVTGLMLIPLTPYAQFYDGALVLVGIALLLRTHLSNTLKAALCIGLYGAALATQANVDFPTKDLLAAAHTDGVFWLAPALVAAATVLAVAGVHRTTPEGAA
jgi:energy-converting hydrogenase Eha subunit C